MEMAATSITKIPKPVGVLGEKKEKYGKAFLLGLLLSALIFIPYMIIDQGYFFFYGDFNVQQIPFYKLAHEAIRTGQFGWNWYTDLGANFVSSYSFYLLGSPFFWLTLPFPTSFVPYLMGPLFCLKFATATTTSYAYITKFVKNKDLAILGGILYAFSGFSIYNIFFNHFHECIAFFPLLLIGLEDYMKENKRGLFFFAVFLNAMVNYIFFFGEAVFLVIYFIARLSTGDFKLTVKRFFTLAFEACGGFLMAAFLVLPAIIGVLSNPRLDNTLSGWSALSYDNVQRYLYIIQSFFFPPELPARPNFFPDSNAKWSSVSGWLPLIGMSGAFAFIQSTRKNFIRRILLVCGICAMVPILNSAFTAFNSSYYARWFYMPVLMLALASVIAFEDKNVDLMRGWRWNLGFILAFVIAIGLTPTMENGEIVKLGLYDDKYRFLVFSFISIISMLIVYFIYRMGRKSKDFVQQLLLSVCAIAVITGIVFIGWGKSLSYKTDYMINSAINGWDNWTLPDDPDDKIDYYRIDVFDGMDNSAMFWHLPSIQAFQSVVPGSVMEFYPEIGIERGVASRPDANFIGLRSLTSVKYTMAKAGGKEFNVSGYTFYDTQNGFDVYQNNNYIPMGFTYDNYMTYSQFYTVDMNSRDQALVKALLLTEEQMQKYPNLLAPIDNQTIFNTSYDSFQSGVQDRQNGDYCDVFEITNTGFTAQIDLSKENLVFFSVPYEEGWSVEVDGVAQDVEKVNIGFMATYVPAGEHTITFTYKTPGLQIGGFITLGMMGIFLIYIFGFAKKDWKKDKTLPLETSENILLDQEKPIPDGPENAIDYFAFVEEQVGHTAFSEFSETLDLEENNADIEEPFIHFESPDEEVPPSSWRAASIDSELPNPNLGEDLSKNTFEETREIHLDPIPDDFSVKRPQLEYHPPEKKDDSKKIQEVLGEIQENLTDIQQDIAFKPKEEEKISFTIEPNELEKSDDE